MRALASLLRRLRPRSWLGKGGREDGGEEGTEEERQMNMVPFLLYLGANPTAKNKKGTTPLMELARFQAQGEAR
jgi:ankyrin repeat protein